LREYNRKFISDFADYNFHIEKGEKIIEGVVAASTFDTLEVEFLFVDENYRGKWLGTSLLQYVENAANKNGLQKILLNTYSFQAPEFYKKLGCSELLKIAPCFGEYSQSYLLKNL
jgi:GNAT superfamily N-acetyltransferase